MRSDRWSGWAACAALVVGLVLLTSCGTGKGDSANDAARDDVGDAGVDPDAERQYEHFFYFESEADARSAADELQGAGFTVTEPSEGVGVWSVMATRRDSLDAGQLDALTSELTHIAERHNGTYDGWGTPL